MVIFSNDGQFCQVTLSSSVEQRRVLQLVHAGVFPALHHRDSSVPDWMMNVSTCSRLVAEVLKREAENEASSDFAESSVIELSGLPGVSNREWAGVRLTGVVIASMIHRTFQVKTSADMVFFNEDRTVCWCDLQSSACARRVISLSRGGVIPSLHQNEDGVCADLAIQVSWPSKRACSSNAENRSALKSAEARCNDDDDDDRKVEKGSILVTGLPGAYHPSWRFLNGSVIASILFRTFGVRTSPDFVTISPDRKCARVQLSMADARHVLQLSTEGQYITLHHRDPAVLSLRMLVKPLNEDEDPVEAAAHSFGDICLDEKSLTLSGVSGSNSWTDETPLGRYPQERASTNLAVFDKGRGLRDIQVQPLLF